MKGSIGRRITAGLGAVLVVQAFAGGLTYRSTIRLIAADDHVAESYRILQKLVSLGDLLKDAESRQRGYIITGEERYLDSYDQSLAAAHQELMILITMASGDSILRPRIESIQPAIDRRLIVMKTELELRKYYGFDSALRWVQSGRGKQIMDEIDKLTADLVKEEREALFQRQREAEAEARQALLANIAGALATLFTAGFAGFFLVRSTAGPLREITSAAEKIASEATNFKVSEVRNNGFAELASALNRISGKLKDKEAALAREIDERHRSEETIKELAQELDNLAAKRAKETAALEHAKQRIQELAQKLDEIASA
jgi:CHASE3 domain sensor protein